MTELFADRKTETRLLVLPRSAVQQNEAPIGDAFGMFVNVVVLVIFFKSVYRLQLAPLLCGKAVTTLVSASCKRSATAGGLHSGSETVNFASLSFLGLVGSFHNTLLIRRAKARSNYLYRHRYAAKIPPAYNKPLYILVYFSKHKEISQQIFSRSRNIIAPICRPNCKNLNIV